MLLALLLAEEVMPPRSTRDVDVRTRDVDVRTPSLSCPCSRTCRLVNVRLAIQRTGGWEGVEGGVAESVAWKGGWCVVGVDWHAWACDTRGCMGKREKSVCPCRSWGVVLHGVRESEKSGGREHRKMRDFFLDESARKVGRGGEDESACRAHAMRRRRRRRKVWRENEGKKQNNLPHRGAQKK